MHKIIKVLKAIGTTDCYVKRPNHAKDKKIEIGMLVYAEKDANGFVNARKRAPRGGGNCVGVVLSDKRNREGMHEIAVLPEYAGIHCPF
jgi:hypothetical protein